MSRTAARITQDEVARMVKAVRSTGLSIARVTFDGKRVDVIIGETEASPLDDEPQNDGLLREPKP